MMRRSFWLATYTGAILVAASLCLSACADGPAAPVHDFSAAPANPIQISRTRLAHLVSFPQGRMSLESSQASSLFKFIAAQGVGPADTVLVEHGVSPAGRAQAESLMAVLSNVGLRPSIARDAALGDGLIRVVVERYVAIAPDCPDWSGSGGPNFQNDNQKNFGCADAKNLAAMVADPKDLAMGAGLPAQVGDPVTRPVFNYRAARPTGGLGGGVGGGAAGSGANGVGGASGSMGGVTGGGMTTGGAMGATGP